MTSIPESMVERVARALQKECGLPGEDYMAMARVAIEAMRQPTGKMVEAGAPFTDDNGGVAWQSMIDAALDGR